MEIRAGAGFPASIDIGFPQIHLRVSKNCAKAPAVCEFNCGSGTALAEMTLPPICRDNGKTACLDKVFEE